MNRASIFERIQTAWNTLWDRTQARLVLRGPLPLWMQNAFEQEAERQQMPVGSLIYDVLREEAERLIAECAESAG